MMKLRPPAATMRRAICLKKQRICGSTHSGAPSRQALEQSVCSHSFALLSQQTLWQIFATSYAQYYEKVAQRGLSSLIAISDEAFESGLQRFRRWIDQQPANTQVYEPVDMFVFRKMER